MSCDQGARSGTNHRFVPPRLAPDLKADNVLANLPLNDSDWDGDLLALDVRWKYGPPPSGNANFAWIQHFVHHLAPNDAARCQTQFNLVAEGRLGEWGLSVDTVFRNTKLWD